MMTAATCVPVLSIRTYDAIDIGAISCCLLWSQKVRDSTTSNMKHAAATVTTLSTIA